ncbi:MAG: RimK family alpha-L-glutamate ligase [Bdellovibrionales bacterium]|nr:RimK family alpha-L-glutamate ligase [Bdellovibrionales bacterium]
MMRIRILARNRSNFSNQRFREEAKHLKCQLQVIDPLCFDIVLGRKLPLLYKNGKKFEKTDMVMPRMGASITNYALAVVSQFEMMGVPVLNSSRSIQHTRDKLRCVQLMTRHDIDIPKTVIIRQPSGLNDAIESVGGFPIILKLISGTQGVGVMLVESMRTLESTLDTLWSLGQDILIQECVKESIGRDIRVIVVGDKVIAAMRRQARIGEFRSNIHRGGIATPVELDPEYARTAIEASKIVGLDIAGVDLLESYQGPKIIEVNASPGMEGIESATGLNVSRMILEHAIHLAEKNKEGTLEQKL